MPSYKDVEISDPLSAFNEVLTAEVTPEVQVDATQGLKTQQDVETFVGTTGTATVSNTGTGYEFVCTTGTDVGGYGLIRTQRAVRYRPGQGLKLRFTARFDNPIALSTQRAGGVTLGNELTFGYDGTDFGILVRNSGAPEIRRLTLSAAASGNETATVTLNGTEFTVSLTSGTTVHNANELSSATYAGWNVVHNNSTITFLSASVDAKSGTYSFSSTGTAAGTFAQVAAGTSVNDTWIYQTDWNRNKCDGSGPFAFVLDPQKGNVYQVKMQYLGYGSIKFFIENPADGKFELVHDYQYANAFTSPSVTIPDYKIGCFVASLGSTTNLQISSASFFGGVEGKIETLSNPDAHGNTQSSVGTTLTNIISIRVRLEIEGFLNLREVIPLLVTMAADGQKNVVFELLLNPTLDGDPDWEYHHGNTTDSIVEIMTTSVTASVNDGVTLELGVFGVSKTGSEVVDLTSLGIDLKRGDVLTLAGRAVSSTSELTGSLAWKDR